MFGAGLLMATGGAGYDSDAQTYITAVETADGQSLEIGVKSAINAFVVGCKADGIWTPIKASCILAGARTLTGALVPLVGTAPTNNGFVSADYDRKTGLIGANNKYLDSNRNNNADPQNDKHLAVYMTMHSSRDATTRCAIGSGSSIAGHSHLITTSNTRYYRINYTSGTAPNISDTQTAAGFWGASRSSSSSVSGRYNGTNYTLSDSSSSFASANIQVFARGGTNFFDGRQAFYSAGTSLNLTTLDSRVTTLINAIAAAIP